MFPILYYPPQLDLALESGEYFLSQAEKSAIALSQKKEAQILKSNEKQKNRDSGFIAPKEPKFQDIHGLPTIPIGKPITKDESAMELLKEKFRKNYGKVHFLFLLFLISFLPCLFLVSSEDFCPTHASPFSPFTFLIEIRGGCHKEF